MTSENMSDKRGSNRQQDRCSNLESDEQRNDYIIG
jgi:hypothetical protein